MAETFGSSHKILVSIIIPCYNEKQTVIGVVENCLLLNKRTNDFEYDIEVIVVDNGSTDGTYEDLINYAATYKSLLLSKNKETTANLIVIRETQKGKANAVKKGLAIAKGDIVVFQDADLEYSVDNIPNLLSAIVSGNYSGAVSERYFNLKKMNIFAFTANKFFLYFFKNIPDVLSGQRAYIRSVLDAIEISSSGFDLEIELTLKTKKYNIAYIPIFYCPRTYKEGKKIGLKDFFVILQKILVLKKINQFS